LATAKRESDEHLAADRTVEITVTGVNDAGEGQASDPVPVVVT
jgi:hypothetical protein